MKFKPFGLVAVFLPAGLVAQTAPPVRTPAQPGTSAVRPAAPAPEKKRVLEEIVARVNNEIITFTEYQKSRGAVLSEVEQDCPGCPPAQVQSMVTEREKNLLRDLIDNMLLVQRAKDLGYNVESDVIKRMDAIRLAQNPPIESMEKLCEAVEASGTSCEDWKAGLRNSLLTQEVVRREVGRTVDFSKPELQKYYDEHTQEFVRPEQVYLFEIFVSTEGKPEAQIPELEKKARNLLDRVKNQGVDFEALARSQSEGSTAKNGGELGLFERGQLSKEMEEVAFKMTRGEVSDVIRIAGGFLILKCAEHYIQGQQPIEKVENEIMNKLYMAKIQPALRVYLTRLREESFVLVKPGYLDAAHVEQQPIVEVQPAPDKDKEKDKDKKEKKKKEEKKDEKKDTKSGA